MVWNLTVPSAVRLPLDRRSETVIVAAPFHAFRPPPRPAACPLDDCRFRLQPLLLLPRRGSGHGSLESIAYRAHSARTAEPVHLAANA